MILFQGSLELAVLKDWTDKKAMWVRKGPGDSQVQRQGMRNCFLLILFLSVILVCFFLLVIVTAFCISTGLLDEQGNNKIRLDK